MFQHYAVILSSVWNVKVKAACVRRILPAVIIKHNAPGSAQQYDLFTMGSAPTRKTIMGQIRHGESGLIVRLTFVRFTTSLLWREHITGWFRWNGTKNMGTPGEEISNVQG